MKHALTTLPVAIAIVVAACGSAVANGVSATQRPASAPVEVPITASRYETGVYLKSSSGISLPGDWKEDDVSDNLDPAAVFNGALGYSFGEARAEFALGYQKNEIKESDDDCSMLSFMANGYHDLFQAGERITPFVMAGVGLADIDLLHQDRNDTVFVWQAGVGVGLKASERMTWEICYRYIRPEGLEAADGGNIDWESNNLISGIRYQF